MGVALFHSPYAVMGMDTVHEIARWLVERPRPVFFGVWWLRAAWCWWGALKASGKHARVLQSAFAPDEALAEAEIGESGGRGGRYRPEQIRRHLWGNSGSNVEYDCGDEEAAKTFYYGYVMRGYDLLESVHVSPIHKARCRIESYMPTKFNNEILAAAIEGFQAQKQRLDAQIAELRQLLAGGSVQPAATPEPMRKRRKMTAAARQRMAEAQRKRWAAAKKEPTAAAKTAKPAAKKPKRKLSAEGRQRIIDATKKRWAAVRAAAAKAK